MNRVNFLIAQRGADSPINRWLDENPIILGIIFLVLGGILILTGVYSLQKGVSRDKFGNEVRGGMGQFLAILRILVGVVICVFAIYKMVVA